MRPAQIQDTTMDTEYHHKLGPFIPRNDRRRLTVTGRQATLRYYGRSAQRTSKAGTTGPITTPKVARDAIRSKRAAEILIKSANQRRVV